MDGTVWKDLLGQLGCLDNGRFMLPDGMDELIIGVSGYGGGIELKVDRRKQTGAGWSYNDDFIIYQDPKGWTGYYAWQGVTVVFTTPA